MDRYYFMDSGSDYIMHHGVLGMKWGHRKDRSTESHMSKRKAREQFENDLHNMSDQDLNKANARWNAEQQYRQHYGPKQSNIKKIGKKIAIAGATASVTVLGGEVGLAGAKWLGKHWNMNLDNTFKAFKMSPTGPYSKAYNMMKMNKHRIENLGKVNAQIAKNIINGIKNNK